MSDDTLPSLPAPLAAAVGGVPAAFIPACVKALDRLIGAVIDIPVAWLEQKKVQIQSKTASLQAVEGAISNAVASKAANNDDITDAALESLLRKEYRRNSNVEAVSFAMLADLSSVSESEAEVNAESKIDDDWLNVFEKYAENASSERMRNLWGRVLSGEIRKPGRFSLRTLRFLSEFSQADALTFADFCQNSFGEAAPKILVKPDGLKDIRSIVYLESSELIQGATGIGGLNLTMQLDQVGNGFISEGKLSILFNGTPNSSIKFDVITLTPLGQELVTLLPGRDPIAAAERVAFAIRSPEINSAFICSVNSLNNTVFPMKILWQD